MPNYPVQTIASAPEGSKSALEQLKKAFGVVPNIVGAIANSPKLINSLVGLFGQVHSPGLTEAENQIVLLTDAVTNSSIRYIAGPVDATNVPRNLVGLRTMFNAFHHFAPRSARLVLENAVQARQPVGIFEIPERSLFMMVPFLFTPIFVALATPFIRPFRWKRLLWTYVVPLIPLTCWWDGLISACRAYTVEELAMAHGLDEYDWKADRIAVRGEAGHLTHLSGIPRSSRV